MKKIILSMFIIWGILNASPISSLSIDQSNQTKESKKYSDILSMLKKEADNGNGEMAYYLANFYLNGSYEKDDEGKIVEKNTELAKYYFKLSVDRNFLYAPLTLSSLYLYHEDFIKEKDNVELAEKYANISIEREVYEAYTTLADIYLNYKEDAKKAVEFLSKGAEQGIATSQFALAVIYNNGVFDKKFVLEKNEMISIKYLTDACLNPKKTKKIESICYDQSLVEKEKVGE